MGRDRRVACELVATVGDLAALVDKAKARVGA
jgi:hypothetical protein